MGMARAASWTWAVFPYADLLASKSRLGSQPQRVSSEPGAAFHPSHRTTLHQNYRTWMRYGALWGVIALTNTALISMLPFFLLWLLYRSKQRLRDFTGMCVSALVITAVITPWLVRNYSAFGKFVFIRDNLPLEMHVANTETSNGLWTRREHPGNDPEAMRRFQELGELRFMEEKQQQFRQFVQRTSAAVPELHTEARSLFLDRDPGQRGSRWTQFPARPTHKFLPGQRTGLRWTLGKLAKQKSRHIFVCLPFDLVSTSLLSGESIPAL